MTQYALKRANGGNPGLYDFIRAYVVQAELPPWVLSCSLRTTPLLHQSTQRRVTTHRAYKTVLHLQHARRRSLRQIRQARRRLAAPVKQTVMGLKIQSFGRINVAYKNNLFRL